MVNLNIIPSVHNVTKTGAKRSLSNFQRFLKTKDNILKCQRFFENKRQYLKMPKIFRIKKEKPSEKNLEPIIVKVSPQKKIDKKTSD